MLQTIVRAPDLANDIALGIKLAQLHGRLIGPADVARVLNDTKVKEVLNLVADARAGKRRNI